MKILRPHMLLEGFTTITNCGVLKSVLRWRQNLHPDLHLLLDKVVVVVVEVVVMVVDVETTTEMEALGLIDINMGETVHGRTDGMCVHFTDKLMY